MAQPMRWVRGWVLLVVMLGLSGIGSHAAQGVAATGDGEFLYALRDNNGTPNQLYGYRVDGVSGNLSLLAGFPISTGIVGDGNPLNVSDRLKYHAGTHRLFVLHGGAEDTVGVYTVDTQTGALTPETSIPLAAGNWFCLAIHPSGSPLLVGGTISNVGTFASYTITDSGFQPAAGSPFTTGNEHPLSCALNQDGSSLFGGGDTNSQGIAGLAVDAATGVLTALPGSPFASGLNAPLAYTVDPTNRLFVASGEDAGPIAAFDSSMGALTPLTTSAFPTGLTQAFDGIWHPAGYYFVATYSSGRVGSYRITGTGANTAFEPVGGSPFTAPGASGASMLELNRTGSLLFAANRATQSISTFRISATTGALTSVFVQLAGTLGGVFGGLAYAAEPPAVGGTAGYVYGLRETAGGNDIYGYQLDRASGMLEPLAGFPIATGGTGGDLLLVSETERLSVDQVNNRLYVINDGTNTLSVFAIDPATGGLTPMPYSPLQLPDYEWGCVEVHPSGSPVIVGGKIDSTTELGALVSFNIGQTTAEPAPESPYTVKGTFVLSCALSHDGAILYTGSPQLAAYHVQAQTGALTPVAGSPFTNGDIHALPLAFATDSSGRLFIAESSTFSSTVVPQEAFAYTTEAGVPTRVSGNPFDSGVILATDGIVHPAGFYIIASTIVNTLEDPIGRIAVLRISGAGADTTLTPVADSPFAAGYFALGDQSNEWRTLGTLVLDHTGTLLLAADSGTTSIATFAIDPVTGGLQGINVQPVDTLGTSGSGARISGLGFAPRLPDLKPTLEATGTLHLNSTWRYTINVSNRSAAETQANQPISVTTSLPDAVVFQSSAGDGWSCTNTGAHVTCATTAPLAGGSALPTLSLNTLVVAEPTNAITTTVVVTAPNEIATGNNRTALASSPTPWREQSITFGEIADRQLAAGPLTLTASAGSGLPVAFTSETPTICAVDTDQLVLIMPGNCTVVARQGGNELYHPAPDIRMTFAVLPNPKPQYTQFLPFVQH